MTPLVTVAAAVSGLVFNCQLDPALAVDREANAVSANVISLPQVSKESWQFVLRLDGENAEIKWPQSPMQVSGKSPIVPTAEDAGMFVSVSGGPCLFTEAACGTFIQYAKQKDGTVRVILTPAALASDTAANTRTPFLVMMDGICTPEGARK